MADKQNPNDPEYDWLYSGQTSASDKREPGSGAGRSPDRDNRESVDSETTQAVPAGANGPEPTRRLDFGEPGHSGQTPPQDPAPAPGAPASFGGTYAVPPTRQQQPAGAPDAPRYATPSPSQAPPQRPTEGRPAGTAPTPPKRRRWWLRILLIALAAWLVFLIVVPIWSWTQITKVDATPDGERPPDTAGTTYLLVGSDSREGLTKKQRRELGTGNAAGRRTDTILMLHVPDGDGPNLLLSIPRDSYVSIPGHGKNKVNAAYAFGGPKLLVETVEANTDVRIDNYIEIGFAGFVDVVDAVGGITVCPEVAIKDPKAGPLKLKKGCQEVDGRTALGYSRSRAFPLGDITRAEHQREVIAAVGQEAASWQTVVFPWRYWSVNRAAAKTLQIGEGVGPLDLAKFGWAMGHTGGKDTKKCVVPYSSLGTTTSAGSSVIWDKQRSTAVFEAIQEDDTRGIKCTASGQ